MKFNALFTSTVIAAAANAFVLKAESDVEYLNDLYVSHQQMSNGVSWAYLYANDGTQGQFPTAFQFNESDVLSLKYSYGPYAGLIQQVQDDIKIPVLTVGRSFEPGTRHYQYGYTDKDGYLAFNDSNTVWWACDNQFYKGQREDAPVIAYSPVTLVNWQCQKLKLKITS